jgi:hypothetical protein
MNQDQHEKICTEAFGQPFPEIHAFLDQYYAQFPGINHRRLLHHKRGVELVILEFGEEARGPAKQHIELDWGFLPESWEELDQHYFPLSIEEDEAIELELQKLYGKPSSDKE